MSLRVTIAGDIGSGKTTVARRLAGMIDVKPLSIGTIQRQLAQSKGVTTLELNRLAETDISIDAQIDSYLKGLPSNDLVAEARLAWHFIPNTLKVYLYISDFEAVRRIVSERRPDETYDDSDPVEQIFARRKSEVERFKAYYGVDIDNLENYDLVLDTTYASIDEVVRKIYKHVRRPTLLSRWISPTNMIPTQSIRDTSELTVSAVENDFLAHGYEVLDPVSCVYVDHVFYIVDGHARVAAGIRNKLTFVPVNVVAYDDQPFGPGVTARGYVNDSVKDSRIYDWEDAVGFRFPDKIWKLRSSF